MLELGLRRALMISALVLTTTFAAGAAQAEQAAPAVAPTAAGGYAPPSYSYGAPLSYPPPGALLGAEYPPEMRQRSTGMVAGGVVLMSFGLVGLFAGSAMVAAHEPTVETCHSREWPEETATGELGAATRASAPVFRFHP